MSVTEGRHGVVIIKHQGVLLDADVRKERHDEWDEYIFESRGGAKESGESRNPDYLKALELLLAELKGRNAHIQDIVVDSRRTRGLPLPDRRVMLESRRYPVRLGTVEDLLLLRKEITRGQTHVGRQRGAKGGGNPTKRIRISVLFPDESGKTRDKSEVDLPGNRKVSTSYSGPPPTHFRRSSLRERSDACVYVMSLRGNRSAAIKIGFSSDLESRLKALNGEIRTAVTGLEWELVTWFDFETEIAAYEKEQELIAYLDKQKYPGEREVFEVTVAEVSQRIDELWGDLSGDRGG